MNRTARVPRPSVGNAIHPFMSDANFPHITFPFVDGRPVLCVERRPFLSGLAEHPATGDGPDGGRRETDAVRGNPAAVAHGEAASAGGGATVHPRARPSPDVLEAISSIARHLEPVRPDRNDPFREQAAYLVDGLLVRLARGRSALDLAIGDGLASLAVGDRALRLCFSGIGDYARERLGIASGTALGFAALARKLRDRPLLRDAVWRGDVSTRTAEVVAPVAHGAREAAWVARARTETVRALAAAVKREMAGTREDAAPVHAERVAEGAAPGAGRAEERVATSPSRGGDAEWRACPSDPDDEPWDRIDIRLTPEQRSTLDQAMALAGEVRGATAPKWQRLESICEEYLGAHPVDPRDDELDSAYRTPVNDGLEEAKEALEKETRRWSFLERVEAFIAPPSPDARDTLRLDAELRDLAAMRAGWDSLLGHLAMLMKHAGLWRDMGFAKFAQYCEERLGVATRTVEQRAALARRLYSLPALRNALREGRVSYEQARLVADVADERTERAWIERAERTTCIALRREIEGEQDAQMCREEQMCGRAELSLRVPRRVAALLAAALRAAASAEGAFLPAGRGLQRIAEHFIATWKPLLATRSTPRRRAIVRDRGFCQAPGCSRAAVHVHHVEFRSRGGGDEEANLVSLCAAHHLLGIHGGLLRVRGRAPDALEWELVGLQRAAA
jgi:hypothetical protein